MSTKVVAAKIRSESEESLLNQLTALKSELLSLNIAKATRNGNAKLQRIGEVRKSIARVLTVINQAKVSAQRTALKGKKVPKSLREKKTRAIRLALTPKQKALKTTREVKRAQNNARKFAVTA